MNTNLKKKIGLAVSALIIFLGLGIIFLNVRAEKNDIVLDRSKYNIIVNSNNKDILKIEKNLFDSTNINYIKIYRNGSEKIYRIEDKDLIKDIISYVDFNNFKHKDNFTMEKEDLVMEISVKDKIVSFTFSDLSQVIKFKYNESEFLLEIDENLYNFIYELFNKMES